MEIRLPTSEGLTLHQGIGNEDIRVINPNHHNSPPCDDTDELYLQELISRVLRQDQAALNALFKAMSARVHSIAFRITGNLQLAEEVTEDAFFQVWRQAPRFDPERGTAKAWILTIARSRALDAWRSIPPFVSDTDYENEEDNNSHRHDDPPDLLSAVEQNQLLHNALHALEPLPRQLIALAFFRGLSHEDIAIHEGLPLGTVKSHLRRAIIRLRETLTALPPISVVKQ